MPCSVVCLSHATGSGGEEIGKQVAERLGYLYVDEEIVARAAAEGGLEPRDIADEERRRSLVKRVLDVLAEGGGDAWTLGAGFAASMDGLRPADVRALIRETVVQTAARGNVVIVAHAASFAVEPGPASLRVLITASPQTRAQRVAATDGVDDAQATKAVKDSDSAARLPQALLRRRSGIPHRLRHRDKHRRRLERAGRRPDRAASRA